MRAANYLLIIVAFLVAIGLTIVTSTGWTVVLADVSGKLYKGRAMFFLERQLIWLSVSILAALIVGRINYRRWRNLAFPLFIVSLILLALVFVPGLGAKTKGSHRWINLKVMQFQPSELAKFALVTTLAWWMTRKKVYPQDFMRGVLAPMIWIGLIAGSIFVEPDFGTALLCALVGMAIIFLAGVKFRYLFVFGAAGISLFALAIMQNKTRLNRVLAFLMPDQYAQTSGYQLINSIYAFVAGGLKGEGLGASVQKFFYLPEAHTDFIYAILAEELGLFASLAVLLLFTGFCICGLIISFNARDAFGKLLAFGLTMMITVQAILNIGVVTGCLPTTGITLPFISYGGSSLIMSLVMVAVLLNIARQSASDLPPKNLKRQSG